jgi:hypothetical protein
MKPSRLVVLSILAASTPCTMGQLIRQAAGANAAAIQAAVDQFRADLGALNPNQPGSFGTGRREINWDGVGDANASPNAFPAAFFNTNSPRGVVYSTQGTGFAVSASAGNPTGTAVRFGEINPGYSADFAAFSGQRLFTALGSNVSDVRFFVPGSNQPALVSGFGAVFTDVDLSGSARIEYYDAAEQLLLSQYVPAAGIGSQSMSFLGASFGAALVSRVRILSGDRGIGRRRERQPRRCGPGGCRGDGRLYLWGTGARAGACRARVGGILPRGQAAEAVIVARPGY